MRRTLSLLLVALAACGGSDAASNTTAAPVATLDTTPPATAVAVDGCEAAPEPAAYTEGEVPTAVRPCEIPTALVTHTIRDGVGRNAQDGDTIVVDFVGIRAEDGAIFDQSYARGVPIQFPLGRGEVLQGWDDGLIGTQAGSVVKIDVPAELGYGPTPPPGPSDVLQPNDALSFVVEVRAVIAPVTSDDAPLDLDLVPSIDATEVTVTELRAGEGAEIEAGDTVIVHLLLTRGDNLVVLINTYEVSDPLQLVLTDGGTFPGLFEALPGRRVGDLIAVAMPPAQAFGEAGNPSIGLPAGTDVITVVDIVGVY